MLAREDDCKKMITELHQLIETVDWLVNAADGIKEYGPCERDGGLIMTACPTALW